MIDSLIKLIDQLIRLSKERKLNKQQKFKEIIHPLFVETDAVIQNYLQLFQRARANLLSGSSEGEVLVKLIGHDLDFVSLDFNVREKASKNYKTDRLEMISARTKINALAEVYMHSEMDLEIKMFAQKISNIFNSSINSLAPITVARSATVDEKLEDASESRDSLLRFLDEVISEITVNWSETAKSYARLKIWSNM